MATLIEIIYVPGTGSPGWPFAVVLKSNTIEDLVPDLQSFLASTDPGEPLISSVELKADCSILSSRDLP